MDFSFDFVISKEVIILGDFNLPSIKWSSDFFDGYIRPVDRQFLNCFFLSVGLSQWVNEATITTCGNILDLILTSEDDRVSGVAVLPFPHCIHSPVMCEYTFRGSMQGDLLPRERHLWHREKYERISQALSQVDWPLEFSYTSACDDFSFLQSTLLSLVDRYVPVAKSKPQPPWTLKPPVQLTMQRAETWQTYKRVRRE